MRACAPPTESDPLDIERTRRDFPLFDAPPKERIVYFDNACMTLKPRAVIDAITEYYTDYPACGERSVHRLSTRVTVAVDESRKKIADLIGAAHPSQVAFGKNTTEAINQVAWGYPLKRGDVVLTSDKEHNSNLLPWMRREQVDGIRHKTFRTDPDGAFDEETFKARVTELNGKMKLVSVHHVSNLDGQVLPVQTIAEIVHDAGARLLVDGAQSVPHMPIDVEALGMDYLAWSVHKMMGPTGVGCLYGTEEALRTLQPRHLGGSTVADVRPDGFDLLDPPHNLEAGLQDYAGIIGAGAAAQYLQNLGPADLHQHTVRLNERLTHGFIDAELGQIHGPITAALRTNILPFTVPGLDSHDVALYLDEAARIAIRSGTHCVHSYLNSRGSPGWARASLYAYNTTDEVDTFLAALAELKVRMEKAA